MTRKVRIGFTRDFFDREGNYIMPGPGPIVVEKALTKALNEGWIQGAGLDVFEQEPVSPDNPLLKMENVIVSPHFLCHTDEHFINMAYEWKEQVESILNGEMPDKLVNREVWDTPQLKAKLRRLIAETS